MNAVQRYNERMLHRMREEAARMKLDRSIDDDAGLSYLIVDEEVAA